jgi:hypothetical protein
VPQKTPVTNRRRRILTHCAIFSFMFNCFGDKRLKRVLEYYCA